MLHATVGFIPSYGGYQSKGQKCAARHSLLLSVFEFDQLISVVAKTFIFIST